MINNKDKNNEEIELESENEYKKASEKYIYPKGVVDQEAYNNYLIFSNKWKNHIQRFYTIKKSKKVIDLAQSPSKINNILINITLEKGERELIDKINNELYFIVQKSTLFKKRAFGDNLVELTKNGFVPDELSGCQNFIIELAGKFYKAEEIYQYLCEDLEVTNVSVYLIKKVIKENINKIKQLQEEYQKNYSDIRLAYKRSRIDELAYLYRNRKTIYKKNNNREDEKQLLTILDSIKKEVQGDLVLNANINLEIEEKTNEYIKNEMLKQLNISMFILARIAGKMNINPLFLLSRLAHSRYSHFTGFSENGLSSTRMTDNISYEDNIVYNWNKIENNNKLINENNEKISTLPKVTNKVLSLKERLLEKLNNAEKPLKRSKENIDNIDVKN